MTCLQNFAHRRRLLAVCAISAALHLLAIGWLTRSAAPARQPAAQASPRLSVHLSAGAPAAAARDVAPARATPPEPPAPKSASAHQPGPDVAEVAEVAEVTAKDQVQGWDVPSEGDAAALTHRPSYQAVQTPPGAVLSYAILRNVPGQAPAAAGAGRLEWRTDDRGYHLSLHGVMGELESRGMMNDAGFGPIEATARVGAQSMVTAFDWASSRVNFDGIDAGAAFASDGQDRASMLMRLAGLGLGGQAQLNETVELLVAGADGVAVVRFERVGEEEIDSALGKLATVHLVQVTQPGSTRLDVWLAPSRSWYPVQVRVTAPDGSAFTQTITSIVLR